jgi:hypothetical protein
MEVENRLGRELEAREARVAHSFAKNANEWGTRMRAHGDPIPAPSAMTEYITV